MSTRTTAARRVSGRRGRDLRSAMLLAARRLCLAHGAGGVSVRAIAAAVGTSPTAVYLHFRGLDDVLEHLRMDGHARLAAALDAAAGAGATAPDRIRAMGRAYHGFGVANPRDYELMFGTQRADTLRREAVQREMATLLRLRDVVHRGMVAGELRTDVDDMVATNALWAQIHGVTALAVSKLLLETAAGQQAAVLEHVLEAAVQALLPR